MTVNSKYELIHEGEYWRGIFHAMASPCELLIETEDEALASSITKTAYNEAKRIEHKFSRYRKDNIIHQINNSKGQPFSVDQETSLLLDYADQCFQMSNGLFDITSGVLREIWKFDCSDNVPTNNQVKNLLPRIGWDKVKWNSPSIILPANMEIDLGGIGKEYAVDRTAMLIRAQSDESVLINFGGDLYSTKEKRNGTGWVVGIENPSKRKDTNSTSAEELQLKQGGIATSGDVYRYILKDGIRYSHILNPNTGWPIINAPHAVTVVAETCLEAGILATLAILNGKSAKSFLSNEDVKFWLL